MLLRRITKHVQDQNWFAVFIDFLIVVTGVFIGIQVANWNEQRGDQREYQLALERLSDEVHANLLVLDGIDAHMLEALTTVTTAIDALRSCEHTEENVVLIERGLGRISGTTTIHIQMSALDELTTTSELLSQQPPRLRNQFSTTKFNLNVLKTEADFSESLPFRDRPESSLQLTLGEALVREWNYLGIDLSRTTYPMVLASPVNEVCADDQLLKSFYTWHRFQGSITAYSVSMRIEFEKLLEIVGPHTGDLAP